MIRKVLGIAALLAVGAACGVLMTDGPGAALAKDDHPAASWPNAKPV